MTVAALPPATAADAAADRTRNVADAAPLEFNFMPGFSGPHPTETARCGPGAQPERGMYAAVGTVRP